MVISGVFRQMGLADELGSGVRNLFKYTTAFSKSRPEMLEEDIFRVIVPLTDQAAAQVTAQDSAQVTMQPTEQVTDQATDQVTEQVTEQADRIENILRFCVLPRSSNEIMDYLKLSHREHFRAEILKPLVESGKLRLTIPNKPNSSKQKYIATKKAQ